MLWILLYFCIDDNVLCIFIKNKLIYLCLSLFHMVALVLNIFDTFSCQFPFCRCITVIDNTCNLMLLALLTSFAILIAFTGFAIVAVNIDVLIKLN